MIPFFSLLLACGADPHALSDGTFTHDPTFRPDQTGLPAGLALTIAGDRLTFRDGSAEIASAELGAPFEVTGCPRNMSADHMMARPVVGSLTLGTVTLADAVLLPDCQGDQVVLTRQGPGPGPCLAEPCLQFNP